MASERIAWVGDARAGSGLSKTVTLLDRNAEADLEVVQNGNVNRCGSSNHNSNAPTKESLDLLEDKGIIASAGINAVSS